MKFDPESAANYRSSLFCQKCASGQYRLSYAEAQDKHRFTCAVCGYSQWVDPYIQNKDKLVYLVSRNVHAE